ncbi:alpha/beta hydrolase family protein [Parabacteroides sp. ZJ-118]|uniref:alpha/beta hydrolase n=1 Tax=Parabacteroides sp. ZJ-118 TaxID=2709398 RepID=UPI0013EB0289|nr:alpha/beta hydrolase family protein [Parabacteroides sp. ZJ-118]
MNWIKKVAVALAGLLPLGVQAARVDTLRVQSPSMRKTIEVVVVSPDAAATKACPAIYLLHGYSGDARTWLGIKPDLPEIADEKSLFFVCPDGENSWYWDSPLHADVRYETFISKELVEAIDARYNTVSAREGRAITGLSMGGHGAMWNALRHDDVFSAAGSTSGGMDIRPFPENWEMSLQIGAKADYPENWETHTVIHLVPTLRKGRTALIFDCGESDFFLEVNKNYHEALLRQGIDHDFITRPGNHDAHYWNNSIDYQILFFRKHFLKTGTLP